MIAAKKSGEKFMRRWESCSVVPFWQLKGPPQAALGV
jgi:hypothetical protein